MRKVLIFEIKHRKIHRISQIAKIIFYSQQLLIMASKKWRIKITKKSLDQGKWEILSKSIDF